MNPEDTKVSDLNRREFLKGGSLATFMSLLGAVELKAQNPAAPAAPEKKEARFKIKCAVIGMGRWGRFLVENLTRRPEAEIAAICETYPAFLRRGVKAAPGSQGVEDYRKILENKEIEAVFIATPSHLHREITVEALQAGKHVYCEAPLAVSLDEARAIARAARDAVRCNFQPGLQYRSDPQRQFLMPFIRSGAMGMAVKAHAQYHRKESWKVAAPTPEREKDMNWRLRHATSAGLLGEIGVHQLDTMCWFLNKRPLAVTGYGSINLWNDGREVDDTVQAVFEFPQGLIGTYDGTLANSFDSETEMYYGSLATVMVRGSKAWMFKEADSPMLGWEVYARKDTFYKETGIALVANATKQTTVIQKSIDEVSYEDTPFHKSIEAFLYNSHLVGTGVKDFTSTFGDDTAALKEYVAGLAKDRLAAAGYQEGYEATALAIKANEAVRKRQRLEIPEDLFHV